MTDAVGLDSEKRHGLDRAENALLDTRSVRPSDRRDYWSSGIAERFFPMHIDRVSAPSFEAQLRSGQIGPVTAHSIQGLPHRVERTPEMIAAADPGAVLLYVQTRGHVRLEQDGRSCLLEPGDVAIQDTSRPSSFESRENFAVLIFSVPKWFIGAHIGRLKHYTATHLSRDSGTLVALTVPFLAHLGANALAGIGLSRRDEEGAAKMLLPILQGIGAAEQVPEPVADSEALLIRMQQYMLEHLTDLDLSPERIAQAHFVSVRYVYKLFASSGSGVSAWIRARRLELAAQDLRDSPSSSVKSIASRWGYRNATSFSRAFREIYGCSPHESRTVACLNPIARLAA